MYDKYGFGSDGKHKDTGALYNKRGFKSDGSFVYKGSGEFFDFEGYDIDGFNKAGYDKNGNYSTKKDQREKKDESCGHCGGTGKATSSSAWHHKTNDGYKNICKACLGTGIYSKGDRK